MRMTKFRPYPTLAQKSSNTFQVVVWTNIHTAGCQHENISGHKVSSSRFESLEDKNVVFS